MNKLVYGIFYLIDSTMIKIDNDIDEFMCVRVLCLCAGGGEGGIFYTTFHSDRYTIVKTHAHNLVWWISACNK